MTVLFLLRSTSGTQSLAASNSISSVKVSNKLFMYIYVSITVMY